MTDTTLDGHDATLGVGVIDPRVSAARPSAILQTLLDNLPCGVTLFGPDLEMIACNAKLKALLDFPEELFAHGLPSLPTLLRFNAVRGDYGPGDPGKIAAAAIERARKMEPHVFERTRPNGVVLEVRGTPLAGGGFVTLYTDITERKHAEEALRDSTEKLRVFADSVPVMAVSYDANLHCRFANKAYAENFGFTVGNILGKHLREVVGDEVYQEIEGQFVQVLRGHPVTYQRMRSLPDGDSRHLELKVLPEIGEGGQVMGCFTVMTDITEHKRVEERIQRIAHHDSLTGLPNRLLFNDRLNQAISLAKRRSSQFALLYFDLDKFKPVNDTLGHTAGDELLKSTAARVLQQVRESDTVARVGGDEFTVILPDIARRQDIELVAKKIIHTLTAPFELGGAGQSVEIGTSIGIAVYPSDGKDADALVKAADTAMYNAKQSRNCYRFAGGSGLERFRDIFATVHD